MTPYLLLIALLALGACSSNNPTSPRFVVAKGKGLKITRAELTKERDTQLRMMNAPIGKISAQNLAIFDHQVLEQLISKKLLLAEAKRLKYADMNQPTEMEVARIIASFPNRDAFNAQLSKTGMTLKQFKAEIKNQLIAETVFQKRINPTAIAVQPEEVEKFYKENPTYWKQSEQVKARMITVRVDDTFTKEERDAQRKRVEVARERILKGEAFEQVAQDVMDEQTRLGRDGSPLAMTPDQKLPEIQKATLEQKLNTVGPVISSSIGYHLVEALERVPAKILTFDEVKKDVQAHLSFTKRAMEAQMIIRQLRETNEVKVLLPAPEQAPFQVSPAPAPKPGLSLVK